jgi:hypothetical protein
MSVVSATLVGTTDGFRLIAPHMRSERLEGSDDVPIEFKDGQVVVHCTGDIIVLPFSPKQEPCKGVAWLLLQERGGGKIGREPMPKEVDGEMCIQGQLGVLIAADNWRSIDVIIKALVSLKNDLAMIDGEEQEARGLVPRRIEMHQNEGQKTLASGLNLKTTKTYKVKGRGTIRVCVWPEDVEPFPLVGKIVVIDSGLYEVRGVEGDVKCGKEFGVLARPFVKPVDEGVGL